MASNDRVADNRIWLDIAVAYWDGWFFEQCASAMTMVSSVATCTHCRFRFTHSHDQQRAFTSLHLQGGDELTARPFIITIIAHMIN